jgi:DNA repair photolyase
MEDEKMPLKKSVGNMYPWVSHTHAHLGGECPHKCSYCYVDNPRFGRPAKYTGELRLLEPEFSVKYGSGKTIFVENCNDLFAEAVPYEFIERIMDHCKLWPDNTYVFQTKNTERMCNWFEFGEDHAVPDNTIIGCTIESNRWHEQMGYAPHPRSRAIFMSRINHPRKFVTIEPVMDFDPEHFADMIASIKPWFVNLGADSKNHKLSEPTVEKIHRLVELLGEHNIELREKHNLDRLIARTGGVA